MKLRRTIVLVAITADGVRAAFKGVFHDQSVQLSDGFCEKLASEINALVGADRINEQRIAAMTQQANAEVTAAALDLREALDHRLALGQPIPAPWPAISLLLHDLPLIRAEKPKGGHPGTAWRRHAAGLAALLERAARDAGYGGALRAVEGTLFELGSAIVARLYFDISGWTQPGDERPIRAAPNAFAMAARARDRSRPKSVEDRFPGLRKVERP